MIFTTLNWFFLFLLAGYLIGSIPPAAFFVGRLWYQKDISALGSGNPGATNVFRVFGMLAGVIVLAADFAKGFLVLMLLETGLLRFSVGGDQTLVFLVATGLGILVGHNWPFVLRFRGGKGVAVGSGLLTYLMGWPMLVMLVAIWVLMILVSRYASLASIVAALSFPVITLLRFPGGTALLIFASGTAAIIIFSHRANLGRLLRREELKISLGKGRRA